MSLSYTFPEIRTIDDVLPHIDERFRVVEKECGNTYINYLMMGSDTFPPLVGHKDHDLRAAVRRECRGIVFNTKTGEIVSRPFHKFFNAGEREDVEITYDLFEEPHTLWDKLDGSMLRPIPTEYALRWGTKMGVTDVAMEAELWIEKRPKYAAFARVMEVLKATPIFEYTSPENRIVVDYDETDMRLLAIRSNIYGTYHPIEKIAGRYGIPVVGNYGSVPSGEDAAKYVSMWKKDDSLDEGVVVEFASGHRVKIKTDTYTVLHRVKESARTERTFVLALLDQSVDDLLPLVPVSERTKMEQYIESFYVFLDKLGRDILEMYNISRKKHTNKKDFALGSALGMISIEKSTVFSLWDGKIENEKEAAMRIIEGGLVSETKWAEMKQNLHISEHLSDFTVKWLGDKDYE